MYEPAFRKMVLRLAWMKYIRASILHTLLHVCALRLAYLVQLSVRLLWATLIGEEVLLADARLEGDCAANEGLDLPFDAVTLHCLDWCHICLHLRNITKAAGQMSDQGLEHLIFADISKLRHASMLQHCNDVYNSNCGADM